MTLGKHLGPCLGFKIFLAASVAMLTFATTSEAAKRLGAPSFFLKNEPHLVAVVKAREKVGTDRVVFERLETLQGEVADEITVRLGAESFAQVETGESYILGFAELRRVGRRRGVYEKDPRGPSIVALPAVGDALLEDSSAMRRIFDPPSRDGEIDERAVLAAMLEQMERPAPLSRRFVLAELLFRPELQERVEKADLEVLNRTLAAAEVEPRAKEILLKASMPLAARLGGGWLAAASREILEAHGTELELASFVPAMVLAAAEALGENGQSKDMELLAKHLASNNPGVAKAALHAMDLLDPKAAAMWAAKAVESSELPAENRRVLENYLRYSAGQPTS